MRAGSAHAEFRSGCQSTLRQASAAVVRPHHAMVAKQCTVDSIGKKLVWAGALIGKAMCFKVCPSSESHLAIFGGFCHWLPIGSMPTFCLGTSGMVSCAHVVDAILFVALAGGILVSQLKQTSEPEITEGRLTNCPHAPQSLVAEARNHGSCKVRVDTCPFPRRTGCQDVLIMF